MTTQLSMRPATRAVRLLVGALVAVAMLSTTIFTTAPAQASDADPSALLALLPDDAVERFAAANELLGTDSAWTDMVVAAINPDDYECGPSEISVWVNDLLAPVEPEVLQALFMAGVPYWAGDYTVLFDNDPSDTYIGADGKETKEQKKRHRDNQRFWDVDSGDIQLHGMHSVDVADDAKVVPLVQFVLGVPLPIAQLIVDEAQALIEAHPALDFDHPLWSLNAFAVPGFEIPGFAVIPDKLVMGDGVIEAVNGIGLGRNAPDYIHAHEFAHHVQFELNEAPPYGDPETDRRTELMADALGAYYAAHARGASFQTHRVVDLALAAGSVGDCNFDQPGHHGTPNQRAAAAEWGSELAENARPQGKIKSATLMVELFDEQLPIITAPDA